MITTRIVPASQIADLIKQAKRENKVLSFQKADATTYVVGYTPDHDPIGFVGILITGSRIWYKNDYVKPMYRGLGYYATQFQRRNEICKQMGVKSICAFCTDASLPTYRKNGAAVFHKRGETTYVTMSL